MNMTIQVAASALGVSVHTLRFYEQAGLLDGVERDSHGYRRYREGDLEWLRFLLCLRGTGMSVADMARYAALAQTGDCTREERRQLLQEQATKVERDVARLEEQLAVIRRKIDHYDRISQFRPAVRETAAAPY